MKIKVTAIILVLILIPLTMTGCIRFAKEFIYEYKFWSQYDDGFATRYGKPYSLDDPLIAVVGGRQKEYDLDEITLDFIYGGESIYDVAIYVSRDLDDYSFLNELHDDYKNIPGLYFINEKTQTEFACGPFDIEVSWSYGLYYHFVDTWTVPKEIFNKNAGRFIFWIFSFEEVKTVDGEIKYQLYEAFDTGKIFVIYKKNGDKIKFSYKSYID